MAAADLRARATTAASTERVRFIITQHTCTLITCQLLSKPDSIGVHGGVLARRNGVTAAWLICCLMRKFLDQNRHDESS